MQPKQFILATVLLLVGCLPTQPLDYQLTPLTNVPGLEDCVMIELQLPHNKVHRHIRCANECSQFNRI
jgi:hypothetical protein